MRRRRAAVVDTGRRVVDPLVVPLATRPSGSPRGLRPALADRACPAPEGALADSAQPREPAAQPQRDTAAQPRIDALEKKAESAPAEKRKEQDLPRRKADTASKPSGVSTLAQSERRSTQAGNAKSGEPRPTSPSAAAAAPSIPPPPADARDERVQQKVSASAPLPITIQSPEAAVQWRITGRTVERTADGGRTWQPQAVTSPSDLLAGRAPSKDVCWIVGRSGLVLLTTDGTTWRRLTFPDESVDLIAITAPDALTATVTTALGRRYRTGDAGRTWTLQENPAAPF